MVTAIRDEARAASGHSARDGAAWGAALIAAFAAYYFAPGLPLSLALLVVCAALCLLQLPLAVSLVPLAMPFFMLPKQLHLGQHMVEFSLGETAIVLCAAAYILRRLWQPVEDDRGIRGFVRNFVPASRLERAVALFLVAATLATIAAHFRHVALRQYREVILEPIVYYVLVLALLRDARAMTRALWALAGSGLLVALLGLGQYLFRYNTLSGYRWVGVVRYPLHLISAVYGSPDNAGLLLDRAIPVAVVLGLAALILRQEHRAGSDWTAYLAWPAVLIMGVALVLTGSRGGLITAGAVSVLALALWLGKRDRRLELAGAALIVAGAAAVLWKVRHGLSTIARVYIWQSGLHMVRDHPLFGVGPDNFLYYYFNPTIVAQYHMTGENCIPAGTILPAKHYIDPRAWQEPCLSHPHNVVLDTWLSTGLLGLIALALLLVAFVLLAYRTLRQAPRGTVRTVQVAAIAIVVATLAHGLVDNSIFVPDLAVAFWLALALTANLSPPAPQRACTR